ncbi:MAG TPA: hypothetical protein VGF92_09000, partial [Stellaceae bacterium]
DIHWFEERSADYSHYRPLGYRPPAGVKVDIIPSEKRLCDMLIAGELDAVTRYFGRREHAARTYPADRSTMSMQELAGHPRVRWLFDDRKAAAIAYNAEIGWPQPIHCLIVKTEIVDQDPSVPARLTRAFLAAANTPSEHSNVHAASYQLSAAEEAAAVGAVFTPAGLKGRNREAISRMLELCWKDGYIDRGRPFTVDEYFDGSTLQL